jgi:hypothetical protein
MATITAVARPARAWRLGNLPRKAVLSIHIVSAGTWFGLDVAMAALVVTALGTNEIATKAFAYRALELVAVWPIIVASLTCLASGVVLGLGTSFGLIRYWWVAIKLVLNLVLSTLVLVLLRPGVIELADRARESAAGQFVTFVDDEMMFPPIVSSVALLVAFLLSVFKPWGRIRGATKR